MLSTVGLAAFLVQAALGQDLFEADLHVLNDIIETQPVFLSKKPKQPPNLVWFLTDDQDQKLGGSFPLTSESTPMPQTKRLMQDQGAYAENWYIHTPICSPSRSELLTGRYFHNIKQAGKQAGPAYMHVNYTEVNANTFARILKEKAGYVTGMFGKYVNVMPKVVPPGWDAWLANPGGNYIAPSFQTKGIDGLPDGDFQFSNDPANYTTSVVGNYSINWIKKVAKQGKPFLAYIAPKAAHAPFNPPVWYKDHWDPSWPQHEPRGANWNCSSESRKNHHGRIPLQPMLTENASKVITGVFKNRWRTLMAVDDLIAGVIHTVEELGLIDNTYFFYSTDHGFELGQFNIIMDKRHMYEWDIKIHLLARGPGIKPGSSFAAPGTQVDIAPTLLGLAGLSAPASYDGHSIVPFLVDTEASISESTRQHLQECGDFSEYQKSWRTEVFVEYYYVEYNVNCAKGVTTFGHNYPQSDSFCVNLTDNTDCWSGHSGPTSDPNCYQTEDPSNNFIALRRFEKGVGTLYAEFQTGLEAQADISFDKVDFVEHYEVEKDPWQMKNLATDPSGGPKQNELHERVHAWFKCSGRSCP